jgi:hypothetical protein
LRVSVSLQQQNGGDFFSLALVSGDFNDDGNDDLAIGTPGFDQPGQENAGLLLVLYGTLGSGLRAADG